MVLAEIYNDDEMVKSICQRNESESVVNEIKEEGENVYDEEEEDEEDDESIERVYYDALDEAEISIKEPIRISFVNATSKD